ncbi:hypothetical protein JXO52_05175 [bacterium]|nr:hypothetical protein [bacterium]
MTLSPVLIRIAACLLLVSAAAAAQTAADPETIDPLAPGITDFLHADLMDSYARAGIAYQKKDYRRAAQYYLAILHHKYDEQSCLYNLACCYAQLGAAEQAANTLICAVNAGYTDVDHIKNDTDFKKIGNTDVFKEAMRRIDTWREGLGSIIYIKSVKLSPCYVQLPESYTDKRSWPLVIGLHGNGGNGKNFIPLWRHLSPHTFIFAAPEGAYTKPLSGLTLDDQLSWDLQIQDKELWKRADTLTLEYIGHISDEIAARYAVGRVYLLGFSQGAGYTYITGIRHPDRYAGIICIGGSIPATDKPWSLISDADIAAARGLPVLIAHSPRDRAAPYLHGVQAKERLERLGYDVTFLEYTGGHTITPELFQRIAAWIEERERKQ